MSYVNSVLQPGEKLLVAGRLSWTVYRHAIAALVVGIILVILEYKYFDRDKVIEVTGAIFGVLALISAAHAWFIRWTTEIAVTDKRIIHKRGFITRHTAEMNIDKVSTVDVDQNVWGRMFDYGSVHILGAGGATGIERLDRVAAPLALRNAIEVK